MIGDGLWSTVFLAVGMSTILGSVVLLFLISTTFWKTANLLPISIGIFLTYLFQSLSFFFFDTDLCKVHGCYNTDGTLLAIISPVCWFVSGIAVLNMMLNARAKEESNHIKRRKEDDKVRMKKQHTACAVDKNQEKKKKEEIDLDKILSSLPNPTSI